MGTQYFSQQTGRIELFGGQVRSEEGCEINVVGHCNLACRACSHLSPVSRRVVLDARSLGRDLEMLSRRFHASYVKVLGGEPLLHASLPELLRVIRSSGIADKIRVCTNGTRLDRTADELWEEMDELEVSAYPGHRPTPESLDAWRRRALNSGVDIRVFFTDFFRESYSELVEDGASEVTARVYRSCQMAHRWRCHTVDDGYFYKCPPSLFVQRYARVPVDEHIDGIRLHSGESLLEELWTYLTSTEPLQTCKRCCGTVGLRFPHEETTRPGWRAGQERYRDEMLDWEHLNVLERDPGADDGSVTGAWP